MTTRRNLLMMAGGVAVAGGTAALLGTRPGTPEKSGVHEMLGAPKVPDLVLADSRHGLVVLGGEHPGRLGEQATASPDGSFVYAVTDKSDLVVFDPADGISTRSEQLGGGWLPRVISGQGWACALSPTAARARPTGRARSPLLVASGGRQRRYDLAGVIEPDAFTSDDLGLFVLEWLPAAAPERYRVRLLDLAAGTVGPLFTRDKTAVPPGAEEEMSGEGRQAVLSPNRQILYTLYTHQPGHRHTRDLLSGRPGNAHAFVHTLHLTERWAYCIDLPHPFGEGPASGHAVAVSADGKVLAVLDSTSGSIAYADTTALAFSRFGSVPVANATASLAFTPDGKRVLAGAGRTVHVLDYGAGTVTAHWSVPGAVRGLGVSPDGARVYCGGTDEVRWLDAGTGVLRGRSTVDGLVTLRHVR